MQKQITIPIQTAYTTIGHLGEETQQIWFICHGYGQLSEYFVQKFNFLNPKHHYLIAPQGLSKFYLPSPANRVGASWMTKEDRLLEIENQRNYLDRVFDTETESVDFKQVKLILFGFSQGVSTICRWAVYRNIPFDRLILWAGAFPPEIQASQLGFIKSDAQVDLVMGSQDEHYQIESYQTEINRISAWCSPRLTLFEGRHAVEKDILKKLIFQGSAD